MPASAYYADAVKWAVEQGITSGTSATTFSPDMSCTRAQIVTFLWRANGAPKADGANPFTDVSADAYYYDAVLWAVKEGITSGTSATTFSPDATVTRAQTVTFLYRAAGAPAVTGGSFADVAADAYYAGAVAWAVKEGVTSGTGGNNFSPDAPCTRGQIVTFMYRGVQ
ncbi:MAG: S-layer homology domain-containing protein [Acutalibacteraceae bacterium]